MGEERERIGLSVSDESVRQCIARALLAQGFLLALDDAVTPQAWIVDHAAFEQKMGSKPSVPVIVVLPAPMVAQASAVIKRGAADCWLLPYDADQHGARLEQILGQARMGRLSSGYGLAALLAHEMKSPVIAVLQQVMALEKGIYGAMDPKAEKLLRRMHLRLDGLAGLIDEWLILSRSISGEPAAKIQVDMPALVQTVLAQAQGLAGQRQVTFVHQLEAEVVVSGDARSLKLMVANLVENGIKYSHAAGSVEVALIHNDGMVSLSVKDGGVGIAPEFHDKIFNPFFRVTQQDDVEGAGLGLALVRAVAQAHGGNVHLASAPEQGSCFTVTLPCYT